MKEETAVLQVKGLTKHFPVAGHKVVQAIDDVSFSVSRGKTLGLVGESGCGKSSCARTIIRIYEPTAGKILLDGDDISLLNQKQLLPYRKKMQMIFQDPYASLNARMTVHDIVAEPLKAHKICSSRKEENEMVSDMLARVGLNRDHAGRYAHEFSGGQRQRVGIARALILKPELVICDEPISALDVSIQAQVVNMLRNFQEELGLTYLFIAHDLSMVTAGLLSSIPVPNPRLAQEKEKSGLEGDLPSPIAPPSGCRFHTRCPYASSRCREEAPELKEASSGHFVACHRIHN